MKFKRSDERYLSQRRKLSESYGPRELWSVIDHWPLYCGISNLARFVAIGDLLRETLHVPGHVAEFGSWRGANLMYMAKLLRIFDPHSSKQVHCFDSFAGLTEFTVEDGQATKHRDRYKGSLEELKELIELYELDDEIVIHQGLIEQTLPSVLEQAPHLTFSFVYCDTDLYQSTRVILEQMHARVAKGGLIVLDEWNCDSLPGEGIATNEFLRQHGQEYRQRHVMGARQPTLVLEKTA